MAQYYRVVEVEIPKVVPDPDKEGETKTENVKEVYYLLHFGLDAGHMPGSDGKYHPVNWTVAICEHIETGKIVKFVPEVLKVIGSAKPNRKEWNG